MEPSLPKRWNMCQAMVHHFWQRWSAEYLQQLQRLHKWKNRQPNIQLGDIVIIRDDILFTNHWPLARVTETFPGKDGIVRVATEKTLTSTFKRPVTKLAVILHEDNQSLISFKDHPAMGGGEILEQKPTKTSYYGMQAQASCSDQTHL